jgi:O-antigen/teichoic acid export membrane protein
VGLGLIGTVRAAARISAEAWFGIDGLGLVTIALSVATIVTIFGAAGMSPGITKLMSELRGKGEHQTAHQFGIYVARRATGFSVVGATAAILYVHFTEPIAMNSIAGGVAAIGVLTLSYGSYLAGKAIAYGEDRIRGYVAREAGGAALFAVGLAAAFFFNSIVVLIAALAVAYLPVGWLSLSRLGGSLDRKVQLPRRSFAGYGAISAVGAMAGIGFTYVTPLAAAFIAPLAGAALVGAVLTVLEPLNLAPRAIGLVLLPDASHALASGDRQRGANALRVSTAAVAAIAAPVCALLILERDRALGLIFSDSIVGGMNLAWFSAAFFVSVVGSPAITSLAAIHIRKASISMWSSLVGFAVAIVVWITLGPDLAVAAIGLGYLAGSIIQVAAPLVAAQRFYRPAWGSFWIRLAAAVAVTAIAAAFHPSLWLDAGCVAALIGLFVPEIRNLLRAVRSRSQRSPVSP